MRRTWDGFLEEKNVDKTTSKAYKSAQFSLLIPNMLLVLTQVRFTRLKLGKYDQQLKKLDSFFSQT